MSHWRVTGQAGWDESSGSAVYYVTKGSKSLNRGDHDDLEALLANAGEESDNLRQQAEKQTPSDCELECGAYGAYCKCKAEALQ